MAEQRAIAEGPIAEGPSQRDIEVARVRDEVNATDTAAALDQQAQDAAAARAARAGAADDLVKLEARAQALVALDAEARALELQALSEAAARALPSAQAAYRDAAASLAAALARLLAVHAVLGAPHRHRINSELGRGDLSPYDMRAVALTLPALESIGYELGPYHGPLDTVAMAGIIRRSAEVELATLTGEN